MIALTVGYLFTAYLMADLVTGIFHWWEDRYAQTSWPVIGAWIAEPNELHHRSPTAFLAGGYWKRNWSTLLPTLTAACVCFIAGLAWWALVFLFASQANEIHALAHRFGKVGPVVKLFQDASIIQSPRHHAEHHRSPHQVRYCVMSPVLNPFLDALKVWQGLERLLAAGGFRTKTPAD